MNMASSSRHRSYMAKIGILLTTLVLVAGLMSCPSAPSEYALSIVSSNGGKVTTPGEGTFTYPSGAVVVLVATPDAGHSFVGWSGDVDTIPDVTAAATTVTMGRHRVITATFESVQYSLTVSSTAGGSVSATIDGVEILVGPEQTETMSDVQAGVAVELAASPDVGYEFVEWVGNVADTSAAETTIIVDTHKTVSAVFGLVPDVSGTWCLYMTPNGGKEYGPDCVYIRQDSANVVMPLWQHDYLILARGSLIKGVLELSGTGTYYGDTVSLSVSASVDGGSIVGTYTYSGFHGETGALWLERCECKKAKAWVRQVYAHNQGYALDFYVFDLIHEGITFTAVDVTGPHIDVLSLSSSGPMEYHAWQLHGTFLGEAKPNAGDIYEFSVSYSDGTSETVTASVRDIFVDLPTPISPVDEEIVDTLTPTFSWQPPSCGCQGYYRIWVVDSQNNDMWSVYPSKDTTSVVYNYDGIGTPLRPGETYEWRLIAFDQPISGGPDNNVHVCSRFVVREES